MTTVPAPPVFLVGSERSGSTMLRLMLDGHAGIRFHHEVDYLMWPYSRADVTDGRSYAEMLQADRIFRRAGLTIDHRLGARDLPLHLLEQLRGDMGSLLGATLHHDFEHLVELWPDARFVHLVRDPRDVAPSAIAMGWAGHLWEAAGTWVRSERSWDALKPHLDDEQYIDVRYSDLVKSPEHQLRRICTFLNVPFDPAMLGYAESSTYAHPDPSRIERWRTTLRAQDVAIIEARCGDLLVERGFERSEKVMEPSRFQSSWWTLRSRIGRLGFRFRRYGVGLTAGDVFARRCGLTGLASRCQKEIDRIDERHLQ